MATVYKAVTRGAAGFARPVAIKRIRPEYRGLKNYIAMFIEEARVGAELAHPNIVQVHDFVVEDGSYCLVMEWVEGIDVGTLLKAEKAKGTLLPWPLVAAIGEGTLHGLGAAHSRIAADGTPAPVIHRDVSPHNILVGQNGVVKLSDFGLARARDRAGSLTAPGTVKGKLSYLAPEVTFGKGNSAQSDIFTTAAVLWELLTGVRLFDGKTDLEVFKKIRATVVPPLSGYRTDVPAGVEAAIAMGLAHKPEARFTTAEAFALALREQLALAGIVDVPARLAQAVAAVRATQAPLPPSGARPVTLGGLTEADSGAITMSLELDLAAPSAADLDLPAAGRNPRRS